MMSHGAQHGEKFSADSAPTPAIPNTVERLDLGSHAWLCAGGLSIEYSAKMPAPTNAAVASTAICDWTICTTPRNLIANANPTYTAERPTRNANARRAGSTALRRDAPDMTTSRVVMHGPTLESMPNTNASRNATGAACSIAVRLATNSSKIYFAIVVPPGPSYSWCVVFAAYPVSRDRVHDACDAVAGSSTVYVVSPLTTVAVKV